MEEQFRGDRQDEAGVLDTNETEQTVETISEETFKKMGEAAKKAVDIDEILEEVKTEVEKNEDPYTGNEMLVKAKEEAGIIEEQ